MPLKTELCAVRGYYRHRPARKADPVFLRKTEQLWDEFVGDECELALREALAVGDGFELHGGLV